MRIIILCLLIAATFGEFISESNDFAYSFDIPKTHNGIEFITKLNKFLTTVELESSCNFDYEINDYGNLLVTNFTMFDTETEILSEHNVSLVVETNILVVNQTFSTYSSTISFMMVSNNETFLQLLNINPSPKWYDTSKSIDYKTIFRSDMNETFSKLTISVNHLPFDIFTKDMHCMISDYIDDFFENFSEYFGFDNNTILMPSKTFYEDKINILGMTMNGCTIPTILQFVSNKYNSAAPPSNIYFNWKTPMYNNDLAECSLELLDAFSKST